MPGRQLIPRPYTELVARNDALLPNRDLVQATPEEQGDETMRIGVLVGTIMAVALLGLGVLVGSMVGTGGAAAQTQTPGTSGTTPQTQAPKTTTTAITQQQAEQAALAASPGNN